MLLIPCPHCGPRDENEFLHGGEAHSPRPGPAAALGEEEWADWLFGTANPKGMLREKWLHEYGCRQWFHLDRDTATHAIAGSSPIHGGGTGA